MLLAGVGLAALLLLAWRMEIGGKAPPLGRGDLIRIRRDSDKRDRDDAVPYA